jgi:hypothetical protein
MSLRVPANHFEVVCHFTIPGQDGDVVSSLAFSGADAASPPNFTAVTTELAELQGNMSQDSVLTSMSFRLGSAATDDPVEEVDVNLPGIASGECLPCNNALLVQKRTAFGGRRNRGRNFWPGLEKNGVSDAGLIASATLGGMQTNWEAMQAGMEALGYDPVLLHQQAPFPPTPVVTFTCQQKVATQRTRLRG